MVERHINIFVLDHFITYGLVQIAAEWLEVKHCGKSATH